MAHDTSASSFDSTTGDTPELAFQRLIYTPLLRRWRSPGAAINQFVLTKTDGDSARRNAAAKRVSSGRRPSQWIIEPST